MHPAVDSPDLLQQLEAMSTEDFDALTFGVIGFNPQEVVTVYNTYESVAAGLSPERVVGLNVFTEVAPCTNNYLIAERYRTETELDDELDYVFTLRMQPTPVRLRLLSSESAQRRYMVVDRIIDQANDAK